MQRERVTVEREPPPPTVEGEALDALLGAFMDILPRKDRAAFVRAVHEQIRRWDAEERLTVIRRPEHAAERKACRAQAADWLVSRVR